MYRSLVSMLAAALIFAACSSTPLSSSSFRVTRYGAGSIDDTGSGPAPSTNKAAAPGGIQKIRLDERTTLYTARSAELDASLAIYDIGGAMAAYEAIYDLYNGVSSGFSRIQEARAKIDKVLNEVSAEAVSVPADTVVGLPFKKDFSVRFSVMTAEGKKPLSGLACTVSYPGLAADGQKTILAQAVSTNAEGLAVFSAPVPASAGKGTLLIAASLTSKDATLRDSLNRRKESGQLAVSFAHLAGTNNRRVPTTISILDFDKNGKAVTSSNTSATVLLKPLVQKGFARIGMADFPKELTSGDEAALLKAAKAQFGSAVERFIFGTVRVNSVTQGEDGLWACTMTAEVTVWNFVAGTEIRRVKLSETGTAKTEYAAIEAARTKLCGGTLVNDLYFNL